MKQRKDIGKMSNKVDGPIIRLAEAHENAAKALREIAELGVSVPRKVLEDTPQPEAKKISLEDVRGVLAEKSRQGHTAAIKEILKSFGASKLSEVKAEDYQSVLEAVEGI